MHPIQHGFDTFDTDTEWLRDQSTSYSVTRLDNLSVGHAVHRTIGSNTIASPDTLPRKHTIIQQHRPLPPAKRGGRRGRLTAAQAEEQKKARLRGVCIRCKKSRIKVRNSIPSASLFILTLLSALAAFPAMLVLQIQRPDSGRCHVRGPSFWT